MKKQNLKQWLNTSKTNLVCVLGLGVVCAGVLTAATMPIFNHIKIAASPVTEMAVQEMPDFEGVAQSGVVDINESGGMPQQGEALGSIQIDGTSVNCTLYFGDGSRELHAGAGIWTGGKIPGQNGTVLVAGHTNSFFRDLESVTEGADILVQTRYGEYHYRVTGMQVAQADDTTAYDLESETENMILYTCYPFGQVTVTPERYFVYAEYVSGPMIQEAADETD